MNKLLNAFFEKREPGNKFQTFIMIWVYVTMAIVLLRWLGFLPDIAAHIAMAIMAVVVLGTSAAQSFARRRRK
ncbi:hypothetical protein D1B31_13830 [Neobacillus notoginsengisoli]|uniref:Uncharacterized protein n=1 Tax=Neobacillus notoginsengisoli TaxID=1578198 RepID=A0A417YSQ2_9BACI|nr:hypothetical protein [Neobacillus notoginsengisoli]RHW39038.1 hypothetical protein D1B31_13830 [Neobacillus notoginsengisoli]